MPASAESGRGSGRFSDGSEFHVPDSDHPQTASLSTKIVLHLCTNLETHLSEIFHPPVAPPLRSDWHNLWKNVTERPSLRYKTLQQFTACCLLRLDSPLFIQFFTYCKFLVDQLQCSYDAPHPRTCAPWVNENYAPKLWNSLPSVIRSSPTLNVFKSRLKTHLFNFVFKSQMWNAAFRISTDVS